jgi:hypothetical protein
MIRGWLEPGLVVVLSCHAAAWLSQEATHAANSVAVGLRPRDHFCVHCGQPNVVDFEDLIYSCGGCHGRNYRVMELTTHWPTHVDVPAPTEPEGNRPEELLAADSGWASDDH